MNWLVFDALRFGLVYGAVNMAALDLWMRPVFCSVNLKMSKMPKGIQGFDPVPIATRWSKRTSKLVPVKRRKYRWKNDTPKEITGLLLYDRTLKMPMFWLPLTPGTSNGGSLTVLIDRAIVTVS